MDDSIIRTNIARYYEDVELSGGHNHNCPDTLKEIDRYYDSKFKSGDRDELGFRKFFRNIVKPACDVAAKFIDLDTKDIILNPKSPGDEFTVWMMSKRLKQWLEDSDFAYLLNELAINYPKYGHIVIKRGGKFWHNVPIVNLRLDPGVSWIKDSEYVYEAVHMTAKEIKDRYDTDVEGEGPFVVYDCYIKTGDTYDHIIKANLHRLRDGNDTPEQGINQEKMAEGVELFSERGVELPYRELKWENRAGRWLGYGFVEYLKDDQIAINEAENLERRGLMFTALKLYQTRDVSLKGSNVLTGAKNGDILTPESELTPVAMEERNLAAFNATDARWTESVVRKTFSTDVVRGDNLPSRTPLGTVQAQIAQVANFYDMKRENFGKFVKDLIIEDVLPSFKNDTKYETTMVFLGNDEEIDKLDETISRLATERAVAQYALRTGFFPSKEQIEEQRISVRERMKQNQNRYIDIPDGTWENAKYSVQVITTGEAVAVDTQSQIVQLGLQVLGGNPGILQNPATKAMFFKLLSLGGVSPVDLNLFVEQPQQPQQGPAGSVARPQPATTGNVQTTQTF